MNPELRELAAEDAVDSTIVAAAAADWKSACHKVLSYEGAIRCWLRRGDFVLGTLGTSSGSVKEINGPAKGRPTDKRGESCALSGPPIRHGGVGRRLQAPAGGRRPRISARTRSL